MKKIVGQRYSSALFLCTASVLALSSCLPDKTTRSDAGSEEFGTAEAQIDIWALAAVDAMKQAQKSLADSPAWFDGTLGQGRFETIGLDAPVSLRVPVSVGYCRALVTGEVPEPECILDPVTGFPVCPLPTLPVPGSEEDREAILVWYDVPITPEDGFTIRGVGTNSAARVSARISSRIGAEFVGIMQSDGIKIAGKSGEDGTEASYVPPAGCDLDIPEGMPVIVMEMLRKSSGSRAGSEVNHSVSECPPGSVGTMVQESFVYGADSESEYEGANSERLYTSICVPVAAAPVNPVPPPSVVVPPVVVSPPVLPPPPAPPPSPPPVCRDPFGNVISCSPPTPPPGCSGGPNPSGVMTFSCPPPPPAPPPPVCSAILPVCTAYMDFLGRVPELNGAMYWTGHYNGLIAGGMTPAAAETEIRSLISQRPEAKMRRGEPVTQAELDAEIQAWIARAMAAGLTLEEASAACLNDLECGG